MKNNIKKEKNKIFHTVVEENRIATNSWIWLCTTTAVMFEQILTRSCEVAQQKIGGSRQNIFFILANYYKICTV